MMLLLSSVCCLLLATSNAQTQPARWNARLSVQIGEADGPTALAPVWDIEIGPRGELYVAQPTIWTISVFPPQGQLLRTFGRRGNGPGEFQNLGRTGWVADTLWAMNFRNINLFSAAGVFIRRIVPGTLPNPGPGITILIPGPILVDGSIMIIPVSDEGAVVRGEVRDQPVVRTDQAGVIVDTLAVVSVVGTSIRLSLQGRDTYAPHPYPDAPLFMNTADGRGLVIAERRVRGQNAPASFRVLRTNLRGDTVVSRVFRYERTAITRDWRDQFFKRLAVQRARGTVPVATVDRELREQVDLPAFHTPVAELVPGRDGTIWLRREDTRPNLVDWWVLDADCNLVGLVQLPSQLKVLRADRETVWGVTMDDLDVPHVQVYKLTR